jgi:hypothetical protein
VCDLYSRAILMKKLFSALTVCTIGIFCLNMFLYAQDSEQPTPSFADMARQSRAQHEAAAGQPNQAQKLVDEMQSEQDAAQVAPTGFQNYNAGDYRLFVPFPNTLDELDGGGVALVGSNLGVTNTEVVLGTPVPIPPNLRDVDLTNLARQIAMRYSQTTSCTPVKQGLHKIFHCDLTAANLQGRQVWGSMEIVVASNSLIPVLCVSPDDMKQCVTYNQFGYGYHTCVTQSSSWAQQQYANAVMQARYRDQTTTAQMCEQIIYPSIQLKEDIVVHPASIAETKPAETKPAETKPEQTKSAEIEINPGAKNSAQPASGEVPGAVQSEVPQDSSVAANGVQTASLADLARQSRQAPPHGAPQAKLNRNEGGDTAPPGFQSFTLQYCLNPQQCAEASIVIPEKAEVISRANGQYIFKTTLNGNTVMLYAGPADVNAPYRNLTDVDYVRIRDLANPNGWSRDKTDAVSTQELTIDGEPALMTRFRYQRYPQPDPKNWWIGERALIQLETRFIQIRPVAAAPIQYGQGQYYGQVQYGQTQPVPQAFTTVQSGQFLLGCTAPEPHFADAEALCTTLVNSLRLQ